MCVTAGEKVWGTRQTIRVRCAHERARLGRGRSRIAQDHACWNSVAELGRAPSWPVDIFRAKGDGLHKDQLGDGNGAVEGFDLLLREKKETEKGAAESGA